MAGPSCHASRVPAKPKRRDGRLDLRDRIEQEPPYYDDRSPTDARAAARRSLSGYLRERAAATELFSVGPPDLGGPIPVVRRHAAVPPLVELAAIAAMSGHRRERVVAVAPGVAEARYGEPTDVGASILGPIRTLAEHVAERVDAPGDVVEKSDAHSPCPQQGEEG